MHLRTFVFILLLFVFICGANSQSIIQDFFHRLTNATSNELETARKRKRGSKYTVPLLFGALLVKSIIFPLAFKAMAVMSSIAVLLSTMSLIMSSIVGYAKLALKSTPPAVKVVHKHPHNWAKDDENTIKNYYTLEAIDHHDPKTSSSSSDHYLNRYAP